MTDEELLLQQDQELDQALEDLDRAFELAVALILGRASILLWAGYSGDGAGLVQAIRNISTDEYASVAGRLDLAITQYLQRVVAAGELSHSLAQGKGQPVDIGAEAESRLGHRKEAIVLGLLSLLSTFPARIAVALTRSLPADLNQATQVVAEALSSVQKQLKSNAETSAMTYFRALADEVFRAREARGAHLSYTYVGPPSGDPVIRKFCKTLMASSESGSTWTRAEIERMDNGQTPDVFLTCGGNNCRHQWSANA